jgi:hypothetical protein
MLKATILKELREAAGIVAIGVAFYFYFTVKAMRHDLLEGFFSRYIDYLFAIPFIGGGYLSDFAWVSAGLAIALGFRQSLGESIYGTWMFLLHRPTGWTRLIGVKLAVGVAIYLVCAAMAILAYAWWAATPGTHASPFEWSMTVPAWKIWITMPLLYFGAFLSGIRPGRWVGTRLLPLAVAGVLAVGVPELRWWPVGGLVVIVLVCAILVDNIFFVVRTRDF